MKDEQNRKRAEHKLLTSSLSTSSSTSNTWTASLSGLDTLLEKQGQLTSTGVCSTARSITTALKSVSRELWHIFRTERQIDEGLCNFESHQATDVSLDSSVTLQDEVHVERIICSQHCFWLFLTLLWLWLRNFTHWPDWSFLLCSLKEKKATIFVVYGLQTHQPLPFLPCRGHYKHRCNTVFLFLIVCLN